MTLVYRSPKSHSLQQSDEPGPGSYHPSKQVTSAKSANTQLSKLKKANPKCAIESFKKDRLAHFTQKQHSPNNSSLNSHSEGKLTFEQANRFEILKPKKTKDCKSVFESKIDRFMSKTQKNSKPSNQQMLAAQFKKYLFSSSAKDGNGKLLKSKHRLEMQQRINAKCQAFPSIPDWQRSCGYKVDSDSNQLVPNSNPNFLLLLKQREQMKQPQKSLGPGYYFAKGERSGKQITSWKVQKKGKENSSNRVDSSPVAGQSGKLIHNSIQYCLEEDRIRRIKAQQGSTRKKLLGLSSSELDLASSLKKNLLAHQVLKQYQVYLPENAGSPQNIISFVEEMKRVKIKEEKHEQISSSQNAIRNKHFQIRDSRFKVQKSAAFPSVKQFITSNSFSSPKKQQQASSQTNSKGQVPVQNCTMLAKTFNKIQPYSLGDQRFREKSKDCPGPGSYNTSFQFKCKDKRNTLNLTSSRFQKLEDSDQFPGPGSYQLPDKIIKPKNSNAVQRHSNTQLNLSNSQKKHSLQSLYQNWGRQINYLNKQRTHEQNKEKIARTTGQDNQSAVSPKYRSLLSVKRQLSKTLSKYKQKNQLSETGVQRRWDQKKIQGHLYQYTQIEKEQQGRLGPGSHEIRKQMDFKTFNVTYT